MPLPSLQRCGTCRPPHTELSAVPHYSAPQHVLADAQSLLAAR
ncbi:SAM-dependent methyltransferase, partial [Xanthomonas euvesicatoria]